MKGIKNRHMLIIGGSGMLKKTSFSLLEMGLSVTIMARNRVQHFPESIKWILQDYHNTDTFINSLQKMDEIDDVICWMHGSAQNSFNELVYWLQGRSSRLFHVVGSAVYRPNGDHDLFDRLKKQLRNRYHQIVLGFQVENGRSRWLNHDEISGGVTQAYLSGSDKFVVGQIEPWDMRP